jgi:acetylornithine deacetylase/succinyl-diaminopimelate desuccinylase-like protein
VIVADVNAAYALQQLGTLIAIESPAPAEAALIDHVERELASAGIRTQRFPLEPGRDNLLASVGSGAPVICLNTHADTVPSSGESQPRARREGSRIYGLGACDAKGSLAAMMAALRAAQVDGFPGRLDLLLTVDEEAGGLGARSVLDAGYTCHHVIAGEPTDLNVLRAHAGLVFFELESVGRAAHGATPERGESAIETMLAFIAELRARVTDWPRHDLIGEPSFNLGVLCGGDRANRVPERCTAAVDVRLVPPATVDDIAERAQSLLREPRWHAISAKIVKYGGPLNTDPRAPAVRALAAAAHAVGREAGITSWRAWTEAEPFQSRLGIDAVVFGPGSLAQAHTENEYVEVEQVAAAVPIYLQAAGALCAAGDRGSAGQR